MKYQYLRFLMLLVLATGSMANAEQFWGMPGRKLSNYFSQGFSKNDFAKTIKKSKLNKIRAFYKRIDKYERVVFDLSTKQLPETMVYLSARDKKLTIRFQGTSLSDDYKQHKGTEMFNLYESFSLDKDTLVVRLSFKRPKEIDVFYLENPARLVIDARVKREKKKTVKKKKIKKESTK